MGHIHTYTNTQHKILTLCEDSGEQGPALFSPVASRVLTGQRVNHFFSEKLGAAQHGGKEYKFYLGLNPSYGIF